MTEQYDKKYFSELERAEQIEFPRNMRILREIDNFKSGGKLLDIGVGSGLFLRIADLMGWEVFGIDISDYAIKHLQSIPELKSKKGNFKKGELRKSSYSQNFFDAVNLRHTIEHVEDPLELLESVYHILKPGGVVAIATPNSFGVHAKIFGKLWPHLSPPYHIQFFSKKSLEKVVKDAGFEVLELKTEELSSYDLLRLFLNKIGVKCSYGKPSLLTRIINDFLVTVGQGEGLLLIAKKPLKQTGNGG